MLNEGDDSSLAFPNVFRTFSKFGLPLYMLSNPHGLEIPLSAGGGLRHVGCGTTYTVCGSPVASSPLEPSAKVSRASRRVLQALYVNTLDQDGIVINNSRLKAESGSFISSYLPASG